MDGYAAAKSDTPEDYISIDDITEESEAESLEDIVSDTLEVASSTSDISEATESVSPENFLYYSDGNDYAALPFMFADPSRIGLQTLSVPHSFYLTNIDPDTGELVGYNQEILEIPWDDDWLSTDLDVSVGSAEVTSADWGNDPFYFWIEYFAYDYSFLEYRDPEDPVETIGDISSADDYFDYTVLDGTGYQGSKLDNIQVNGMLFHTYEYQSLQNSPLYYVQMIRELDDRGLLICGLWCPEEMPDHSTQTLLNRMTGYLSACTLYTTGSGTENLTAASPAADTIFLTNSKRGAAEHDYEAVITRDRDHEAELRNGWKIFPGAVKLSTSGHHLAKLEYASISTGIMIGYPGEDITYMFRIYPSQDPLEGLAESVMKSYKGYVPDELHTYTIDGRTVYAQSFYTDQIDNTSKNEKLYIWTQTVENEAFMIIDELSGFDDRFFEDPEADVYRLFDEHLELRKV